MSGKFLLRVFAMAVFPLALLLAGCQSSSEVMIDESALGSTVKVKSGQMLTVVLQSNPTTGYSWGLDTYDASVLQPQGEPEYVESLRGRQLVGAGGWDVFRFNAASTGQSHLKLVYRRPWEKDVAPIQTFEVDVAVQ